MLNKTKMNTKTDSKIFTGSSSPALSNTSNTCIKISPNSNSNASVSFGKCAIIQESQPSNIIDKCSTPPPTLPSSNINKNKS